MRTTKKELLEMLKDFPNDAEIILSVRGNRSTDYSIEERIVVKSNSYDDIIIIKDKLSE